MKVVSVVSLKITARPFPSSVRAGATLALLSLLSLRGAAGAAAAPPAAPAVHVDFIEGRPFAEVLKKAKAEKKPIMVDVFAVWCGPCKVMDKTTFSDPEVVAWSKKALVSARVDAEKGEGRKIATRYAVRNFPTVLFLDSNGDEIDRLLGAHGPANFKKYGMTILDGTSGLPSALARLQKAYSADEAVKVVQLLAQRNDLKRMGPLARRILEEDPDLAGAQTLDVLFTLLAVEDFQEKMAPETADLAATFIPRLTADPRYGMMAVMLARELARRGDVAGARDTVAAGLKVVGDSSPLVADFHGAQALAEKNAGKLEASAATYRKAVAAAKQNVALRAAFQLELADVLARIGTPAAAAEAKTALAAAVERAARDVAALTRAARVALKLKANQDAVAHARSAVGLSDGQDAAAQAALADALGASGDQDGAAAAWRRAGEIEPENAEYQKRVKELKKKPAALAKAS